MSAQQRLKRYFDENPNERNKLMKFLKDNPDKKDEVAKKLDERLKVKYSQREEAETLGAAQREKIGENVKEAVTDAAIVTPNALALGWGGEIADIIGYPEYDEAVKEARERSPIATLGAEALASGVTSTVASPLMAGRLLGPAGSIRQAATIGATVGAGEAGEGSRTAGALIGAGLGGGTALAGRGVKRHFSRGQPELERGALLGASSKDIKKGIGGSEYDDVAQIVKNLEGKRAVSLDPVVFDVDKNSFVKGRGDKLTRKNFYEGLSKRANEGMEKIKRATSDIVRGNALKASHTFDELTNSKSFVDDVDDWGMGISDLEIAEKRAPKLLEQLKDRWGEAKSLADIEDLKRRYQNWAKQIYSKGRENIRDDELVNAQFYELTARNLRKFILDNLDTGAAQKYADLNLTSSNLNKLDEWTREARTKAAKSSINFSNPGQTLLTMASNAMRAASGGDTGKMTASKFGQRLGETLGPLRVPLEDAVKAAPVWEAGRLLGEPGGTPASLEMINKASNLLPGPSRSPQSVGFNLPRELTQTTIPRNTQGMLDNKEFVLAKVAQQKPEMLGVIQNLLNDRPEMVAQVMPAIAAQMPELFLFDKYDAWDGIPQTPKGKAAFASDTKSKLLDQEISSTEYASLMDRLHKNKAVLP